MAKIEENRSIRVIIPIITGAILIALVPMAQSNISDEHAFDEKRIILLPVHSDSPGVMSHLPAPALPVSTPLSTHNPLSEITDYKLADQSSVLLAVDDGAYDRERTDES